MDILLLSLAQLLFGLVIATMIYVAVYATYSYFTSPKPTPTDDFFTKIEDFRNDFA